MRFISIFAVVIFGVLALAAVEIAGDTAHSHQVAAQAAGDHEVWAVDQSNTSPDGGGTLYIYSGPALIEGAAEPETIDLAGDTGALCLEQTGEFPVRPHVIAFNASQTHAILSFVATGHIVFFDAATRTPVSCIDAGEQAHAAVPSPDETYVMVANQNGKRLQRITTDYAANAFALDEAATLDLATCTTPSGAPCEDPVLRPDTAPIFPVVEDSSTFTFVTLRGGGLFVVDSTATPMAIVAEYDASTISPSGLGAAEANGKMYVNSGGASPANPIGGDLYVFRLSDFAMPPGAPNTPAPAKVFSHDEANGPDSHGLTTVGDGQHLWVVDRARNVIVVVDVTTDQAVAEIDLASEFSPDPAPDLIAVSPDGQWAFLSLRGETPLTGDVPEHHNAVGSTPGVAVMQVQENGMSGDVVTIARMTNVVDGAETSDAHAIAVRAI
jgi:hypothetical protein